jgi:tetratricopeptide (TPR) repeat protein
MRLVKIFLLLSLIIVPYTALRADLKGAQDAYTRGLKLEKEKKYEEALKEYEISLSEYPGYVYANFRMGSCYYYLGDKEQALENYNIYLAKRGDDVAAKKFAQRLKTELDAEDEAAYAHRRAQRKKALKGGDGSSFYLGGAIYYLNNNSDDFRAFYGSPSSGYSGVSFTDDDIYGNFHLGYLFAGGFGLEGGFELLDRVVNASYTYTDPFGYSYQYQDSYLIAEDVLFVEPLFRFSLTPLLSLTGGLKMGYANDSIISGYSSTTASGHGVLYAPDLRLQFNFGGRLGLEIGGEYRMDNISPVSNGFGTITNGTDNSPWVLKNSGIAFRLGLNIYFTRLPH